ncbi:MAG: hypothetical protein CMB99_06710 [Flavobacteriaceae bacterium]|nr:hypothetical protein [Flavobacteriaceae bacterium]|tara:strand:+ start:91214 stop:91504 length:291 start_codon:yes stop_codon:yes gene_type:complete
MATKKTKKVDFKKKFDTAVKEAKNNAIKANDFALNTTEEVVTGTIKVASQWQTVTDKALKGGIKLMDNQQKIVFDALETYKAHFLNGRKRLRKIFA